MSVRAGLWVLIGLVGGLAVGGAGVFAGRARAQQAPPGGRYQYLCVSKLNPRVWETDVQQKVNELGSQGWRLLDSGFAIQGPGPYMDNYCFERRY